LTDCAPEAPPLSLVAPPAPPEAGTVTPPTPPSKNSYGLSVALFSEQLTMTDMTMATTPELELDRTPHIPTRLANFTAARHRRRCQFGRVVRSTALVNLDADGAVEVVRHGASAIALITCEHASADLPTPWTLPAEDSWLEGTHWTFDIGARDLAHDLCKELGTVGVLARFSRLIADANRDHGAPDLFRENADGRAIAMNRRIDPAERDRRLSLWKQYHLTLDREVARSPAGILLAVHTFTPEYEGTPRQMEIGVLYDREEALAEHVRAELDSAGFRVAMNEPYSGKDGLMYSVERHANEHGRRALELEVRQDLAVIRDVRRRVSEAIRRTLTR
jgi:predicted N-formylglutamate amidohydrolase